MILPSSGDIVSFKYDPLGRRIQKSSSSGTTNYVYDEVNSIAELDGSGNMVTQYAQNQSVDEPLSIQRSGATSFLEADGLSSVTALTNSAGVLTQSYTFDSFGTRTATTGSNINPFQYTGRDFDSETSLYYYRARYYEPGVSRFLSEDPLGFTAGPNNYRYVSNNPIKFTDPKGLKQYPPNFIGPLLPGDSRVPPLVWNEYWAFEDCLWNKAKKNWDDAQCDKAIKSLFPVPKVRTWDPTRPEDGLPNVDTAKASEIMSMGLSSWLKAAKDCFKQHPLAAFYGGFNELDPGEEATGPDFIEGMAKRLTGIP